MSITLVVYNQCPMQGAGEAKPVEEISCAPELPGAPQVLCYSAQGTREEKQKKVSPGMNFRSGFRCYPPARPPNGRSGGTNSKSSSAASKREVGRHKQQDERGSISTDGPQAPLLALKEKEPKIFPAFRNFGNTGRCYLSRRPREGQGNPDNFTGFTEPLRHAAHQVLCARAGSGKEAEKNILPGILQSGKLSLPLRPASEGGG
ncbi:hypothetical protein [Pontibacter brevis]